MGTTREILVCWINILLEDNKYILALLTREACMSNFSLFLIKFFKSYKSAGMYLTIGINITEFSLNSTSIYWNSAMFDRGICCFFNNISKVHKELLVRYPEIIQHICMSILVLKKTIIFAWLTKMMLIRGVRSKVLGSDNHSRPKSLESLATTPDSSYLSPASWTWQTC
jgi:hypothetical protein